MAAALDAVAPHRYEVDLYDPMSRERGILVGRLTALYGPVTRRVPALWGALYRATNFEPVVRTVQRSLGRGLRRKVRAAMQPPPALVASFHPMLNHVALDVVPRGIPLVTVITDWVEFHHAWTDRRASRIVCPSEPACALCARRGIPADRLFRSSGLPIHPRFKEAIGRYPTRRAARRALKLRPLAATVLLVGGGDGTEPLRRYARALAQSPLDLQVLAVCGHNQALARRIREDNHAGVHVFGFVQNMPELMLASDLLVTRAGPGMIAEGLACGCPLLLTGYLPGQEEGNVREVVRRGLGRYVPAQDDVVRAVSEWFTKPGEAREADVARARAAGNPNAAFEIADLLRHMIRD